MWNGLVLIIAPICVLALAAFVVFFWDRTASPLWQEDSSINERPSSWSALRSIQHILWILVVIAVMAFFFPFLLSFKGKLVQSSSQEKILVLILAASLPSALLLLLIYGTKKKYMEWIADLNWPHRKEEKVSDGNPKID